MEQESEKNRTKNVKREWKPVLPITDGSKKENSRATSGKMAKTSPKSKPMSPRKEVKDGGTPRKITWPNSIASPYFTKTKAVLGSVSSPFGSIGSPKNTPRKIASSKLPGLFNGKDTQYVEKKKTPEEYERIIASLEEKNNQSQSIIDLLTTEIENHER